MENIIREKINELEAQGVRESEIYLGVSCLGNAEEELVASLGWRAIYVETGIFLFIKK